MRAEPTERRCYCGLWQTNPGALERQGIPPGFCGLCQVCGKPGHVRHFPGAVPYTGSWCDRHYRRLKIRHPLGAIGFFLWVFVAVVVVAGVTGWWILG